MKYFCSLLLLLTGILASSNAGAQTHSITKHDTLSSPADSSRFLTFSEDNFNYGNTPFLQNRIINYLDRFQEYHPRQFNLGNAGSAEKQDAFNVNYAAGFQRAPSAFSYFGYSDLNRTFYTSEKPYTKLLFITGQKQEVDAQVIHAHPFGKNCNIAFGFDRTRSTGFYRKQNTNNTSVDLNGWYRSRGKRYAMLADVYWTSIDVAENGGVKYDSVFEASNQLDRQLVGVKLASANTKERYREAWVKQFWSFGNVFDTLPSTDSAAVRTRIYPSWAIVHTLSIRDESHAFYDKDTTSGLFPAIYLDSINTRDSSYLWKISSGVWAERFHYPVYGSYGERHVTGKLGVRAESGEYFNDTIHKSFQNFFADGSVLLSFSGKMLSYFRGSGWYILNGTNASDFSVTGRAGNSEAQKGIHYWLDAVYYRKQADYLLQHFSGNHYQWQNDLGQTGLMKLDASAGQRFGKYRNFFQVGAALYRYSDPVYFDADFLPAQLHTTVTAVEAYAKVRYGNRTIRSYSEISWKNIPSDSPFRLPALTLRESVYAEFHLFRSALLLQTGIDGVYFSAFYGDAYNPELSQFYLQDSKELGNYVFLDPWVSIKVKPVRIFVKADHLNAGFFGRNYYLVPHYPQNDFCLKFGAAWIFND